jgi:CheY-like chemotaxis protein
MLRTSRTAILEKAGYSVASVVTDDDAMAILETEQFDLVLIGRESEGRKKALDHRLRDKYPKLLVLKIQPWGDIGSNYPSRTSDTSPEHVVDALKDMLNKPFREDN